MNITLEELIEDIAYVAIVITIETPIVHSDFAMKIDHIVRSDNGVYIEGDNGCSIEILEGTDIKKEKDGLIYFASRNDCNICIKLGN
ncbi:hypothetical protein [Butyrivibrio sp. INlla21]|uniref:hypothetical protein n=1 Tax=Butyrivibrio sp. INlla21 TaxID=1520811 RepID=UPI0008F3F152|nr:hypothetical protein [Butyrivibrio sp. INlla21]SFU57619.1 hypothetical protein SAMN02910342_00956 [Butyrivibrio sp. INlla21]